MLVEHILLFKLVLLVRLFSCLPYILSRNTKQIWNHVFAHNILHQKGSRPSIEEEWFFQFAARRRDIGGKIRGNFGY